MSAMGKEIEGGEGKERKYYGRHACYAIWKLRRDDIVRVYLTEDRVAYFSALLSWCAKSRKVYRIVSDAEVSKVTRAEHHEGICIVAKSLVPPPANQMILSLVRKKSACVLFLDGVQNPHNLGSLIRTGAHFGISCVFGARGVLPPASGAVCRVAEGGAETVPLIELDDPAVALKRLSEAGFKIIGTASGKSASLQSFGFPRKTVLVLGSEGEGMSEEIEALCDAKIAIPGSGAVESLNVAVAGAICMAECHRQLRQRSK